MEFKVGQKYRIVDIDAWFNSGIYNHGTLIKIGGSRNGDIVEVGENEIDFEVNIRGEKHSTEFIKQLINNPLWHDDCIELITDDEQQSDNTISLYHIADVLEDSLNEYDIINDNLEELFAKIQGCIKSLRKAGY